MSLRRRVGSARLPDSEPTSRVRVPISRRRVLRGFGITAIGAPVGFSLLRSAPSASATSNTAPSSQSANIVSGTITSVSGDTVGYRVDGQETSGAVSISGSGVLTDGPLVPGDRVLLEFDGSSVPAAIARLTDQYSGTIANVNGAVVTVSTSARGPRTVLIPNDFKTTIYPYPDSFPIAPGSTFRVGDKVTLKTRFSPRDGTEKAFFVAGLV